MEINLTALQNLAVLYGLRLIAAALILIGGRFAAQFSRRLTHRLMTRGRVDPTAVSFVGNLVYVAIWAFAIVAAISKLGVQTASVIAVLGAIGLAVGLALQGSLSNFAAGVLLAVFRYFHVGDFIEAGGTAGSVEEIQIFTTTLRRFDGVKEVVPNGRLLAGNIINYSALERRQASFAVSASYDDDVDHVRKVLLDILNADVRTLPDPGPIAIVDGFGENSVNFVARAWARKDDYWNWYWETLAAIKKRFDVEGISMPYPQREVRLYGAEQVRRARAGAGVR